MLKCALNNKNKYKYMFDDSEKSMYIYSEIEGEVIRKNIKMT